jgi:hypothetical protein
MILVCFAMDDEARPFRAWARNRPHVEILVTGVGAQNAERVLRRCLEKRDRPEAVFTCGFAGALDPRWALGDVLYEADDAFPWMARMEAAGAHPARFHQAPRILATAVEKKACRQFTRCDAVEMESRALRSVCAAQRIPSATLRVISDTATEDMVLDFNLFMTPQQRLSYGRLLAHLAVRPQLVPGLLRFHRQTLFAAKQLASTLAHVLES